ncbi:MAG: FGGY family carbohydrate kinase [Terriglobia bacterium]|jgi:xylulokinase
MSFIGIDLGTSFIKGAALNLETRELHHVQRTPFPRQLENTAPLACEFAPNEILAAVRKLLAELAPHVPDCEGIVMCSQMHGMVLMNSRLEAMSNCVTWRDQRVLAPYLSGSESYYQVLTKRIDPKRIKQLGNELDPGRPLCYLFWFRVQGRLEAGLVPASLPDFVLSVLCGSAPGVEITNAGAYGALNLETLNWHEEVIEELGLDRLHWPALRQLGDVVGHLNVEGRRVPCYTPVGDYQCALAGALFGAEEVSLNIATGSQVSRISPELTLGDYQTRPFFEGKFLNTFTSPPGGRALNVIIDLLCYLARSQGLDLRDPWEAIARAAEEVADTDLEVNLNFFPTPQGNGGRIANIRGDNLTLGHLFRAAFKNMADSFFECAVRLSPEKSWKNLLFSGGLACKLEVLRRVIEQRFAASYRIAPCEEDTLFGLLILASVFTGRAKSVEELTHQLRAALP